MENKKAYVMVTENTVKTAMNRIYLDIDALTGGYAETVIELVTAYKELGNILKEFAGKTSEV